MGSERANQAVHFVDLRRATETTGPIAAVARRWASSVKTQLAGVGFWLIPDQRAASGGAYVFCMRRGGSDKLKSTRMSDRSFRPEWFVEGDEGTESEVMEELNDMLEWHTEADEAEGVA